MKDIGKKSMSHYKKMNGLLQLGLKTKLNSPKLLAELYYPGIQGVEANLKAKPELLSKISSHSATFAVVSTLPQKYYHLVEAKAALLSHFGSCNAVPILIRTKSAAEFPQAIKNIEGGFSGILLSDVRPDCLDSIRKNSELEIPVANAQWSYTTHIAAAIINSTRLLKKSAKTVNIILEGESDILLRLALILKELKYENIIAVDDDGPLWNKRPKMNQHKIHLANILKSKANKKTYKEVLTESDIIISSNSIISETIAALKKNTLILTSTETVIKSKNLTVISSNPLQGNYICDVLVAGALLLSGTDTSTDAIKVYAQTAKALSTLTKTPTKKKLVSGIFDKSIIQKLAAKLK